MSYILEALKKAQAERQLGSAPTIHAMPIQAAPAARASTLRAPLVAAAAGMALLVTGAAWFWWRSAAPAAPVVVVAQAAPVDAAEVVEAQSVAAPPLPVAPVVTPPAPVVRAVTPAMAAPQPPPPPPVKAAAQAEPKSVPRPEPKQEAAPPEENLPFMNQLPEPLRSEVPKVTFGGYMYSKNPADRLLLIDKVLRHEGEEVAPGLVLEQLQPKAALMNYRGTRYRVAY